MNLKRTFRAAAALCLSMGFSSLAHAAMCDVDTDGDVDRLDISLIISARKTPAGGPADPRDADGDGIITVLDARACIRQCNVPGCTIIDPAAPSPKEDAGQPDAPDTPPVQNAVREVSKPGPATSGQVSTAIQERTIVSGTEWKVARGDTLYGISRAFYPGDARKQARLRQDIMKLNPSVFSNGANNMAVGVVLKLPDYVAPRSAPPKAVESAQVPVPVPDKVTPSPAPQPAATVPVAEPEPESQVKKEPPEVKGQPASSPSQAEGGVVVSLGLSYGGDEVAEVDGGPDISAGSGVQLRLGYEQMYQNNHGYRASLGLQYYTLLDGDASFRATYLQLAYQHRANPIIYGIGVVVDTGAKLKNEEESDIDYDAAIGAVVYLENVGSGTLAGWGLSYTYLEIDEESSSESADASRAELYYSWRF